jgi:hypothetical protein
MKYAVEVTDTAFEATRAQARYIAVDRQAPLNASRWLNKVWDVVDSLETFPRRHNLATEDAYKTYEVRRALVGDYLILFTVDDAASKVCMRFASAAEIRGRASAAERGRVIIRGDPGATMFQVYDDAASRVKAIRSPPDPPERQSGGRRGRH